MDAHDIAGLLSEILTLVGLPGGGGQVPVTAQPGGHGLVPVDLGQPGQLAVPDGAGQGGVELVAQRQQHRESFVELEPEPRRLIRCGQERGQGACGGEQIVHDTPPQ